MLCRMVFLASVLAVPAAQAFELGPVEGRTLSLGDVSGVVYYTVEPSGYRVVATLGAKESTSTKRFVVTLQPGQSVTVSVPRGPGEPALEAVFTRHRGRLTVAEAAPPPTARTDGAGLDQSSMHDAAVTREAPEFRRD